MVVVVLKARLKKLFRVVEIVTRLRGAAVVVVVVDVDVVVVVVVVDGGVFAQTTLRA